MDDIGTEKKRVEVDKVVEQKNKVDRVDKTESKGEVVPPRKGSMAPPPIPSSPA